jgi:hypothetical protein
MMRRRMASQATPTVVLYPLSSFMLLFGFVIYWVFAAVYLYSSGDIKKRDCTSTWMTEQLGGDATSVLDAADIPCGYEPPASPPHPSHVDSSGTAKRRPTDAVYASGR